MKNVLKKEIKEVLYERSPQKAGDDTNWVEYLTNKVTFCDGTKGVRLGIINVYGRNIKEMANSLKAAIHKKNGWWSLQATNIPELKAAYRAGFRNRYLKDKSLKDHIEAFQKGNTLYVECVKG